MVFVAWLVLVAALVLFVIPFTRLVRFRDPVDFDIAGGTGTFRASRLKDYVATWHTGTVRELMHYSTTHSTGNAGVDAQGNPYNNLRVSSRLHREFQLELPDGTLWARRYTNTALQIREGHQISELFVGRRGLVQRLAMAYDHSTRQWESQSRDLGSILNGPSVTFWVTWLVSGILFFVAGILEFAAVVVEGPAAPQLVWSIFAFGLISLIAWISLIVVAAVARPGGARHQASFEAFVKNQLTSVLTRNAAS